MTIKSALVRDNIRKAVSICALLMSSGFSLAQESVANVVKRSSDAVVLIVTSDSEGQETALGSGFIISADGKIVTNFHVIKGANSAVVKLSSGALFPVSGILASDPNRDLAVLKVNGKNLPFLTLANDDKAQVGDHVVAIGSPLGLEGTVSDGLISSVRELEGKKWIQTTAPVSHGNSGGPLLNMTNEVVGVITWGVNPQSGQSLNFAIPSSDVSALLVAENRQVKPFEGETEQATTIPQIVDSSVYIEPMDGFESFLTAALIKKHASWSIIADKERANYIITGTVTQNIPATVNRPDDSDDGYIVQAIKAHEANKAALGYVDVSISVVHSLTNQIVYAYSAQKNGSHQLEKAADDCANHINDSIKDAENDLRRQKQAVLAGLSVDSSTRIPQVSTGDDLTFSGVYTGVVHNPTVGMSAAFGVVTRDQSGVVEGCIGVRAPLSGSGALAGQRRDTQIRFTVNNPNMNITFEGTLNGSQIVGTYSVSGKQTGTQSGTFYLERDKHQAPELAGQCPTDSEMNSH